jgi:hypothetical protein
LFTHAVSHALSFAAHAPAQVKIAEHSVLLLHASVVVQHEALRHAVQASSVALFVQLVGTWVGAPLPPLAVAPPLDVQKSPQPFPLPPSAPPVPLLEVLHAIAASALATETTTASPVLVELWWRIPWI